MKENGTMNLFQGVGFVNKTSESEKRDVIKSFNDATIESSKKFTSYIDKEIEKSKKIKEDAENLEIMPTNGNILIRIYGKNPWEHIKTTESGLIIPMYNGSYVSKESGEIETEVLAVKHGEVIEVGPDVRYVKPGDDIIFRNNTQLPTPFLGQSLWVVSQNNVVVVINEGLKNRFGYE